MIVVITVMVLTANSCCSDTTETSGVKSRPKQEIIFKSDYDFRNAYWGTSKADIKKKEQGKPLEEKENYLGYSWATAGFNCEIVYEFHADTLYAGRYDFLNEHSEQEANLYLADFDSLKGILEKEFGKPLKCDTVWSDSVYRTQQKDLGAALKAGHVALKAEWKTKPSLIQLTLLGGDIKVKCGLYYFSLKFRYMYEKPAKK